jgi:hypothetical protein
VFAVLRGGTRLAIATRMRPTFRATLLELVVAAAAATTLPACPMVGSCPDNESGNVDLYEPLDPELQTLVDRCRAAGGWDLTECAPMCKELIERQTGAAPWDELSVCELYELDGAPSAQAVWTIGPECIGGRRPDGYCAGDRARDTVGGFLAEQARLEAASVRAFLELANALQHHRAPRVLVEACRHAAADEIVHAVLAARLARRHGVVAALVEDAPASAVPTLEALATANAVEGCVRETWGAVVATWQARTANDPAIRRAMARIAPDETRHAVLSRAIDRWARRRLDDAAVARLDHARAGAIAELEAHVREGAVPGDLERTAGLPAGATAAALLDQMSARMAGWPRSSSGAARSSPSTTAIAS